MIFFSLVRFDGQKPQKNYRTRRSFHSSDRFATTSSVCCSNSFVGGKTSVTAHEKMLNPLESKFPSLLGHQWSVATPVMIKSCVSPVQECPVSTVREVGALLQGKVTDHNKTLREGEPILKQG